jgi:hypothetical protein
VTSARNLLSSCAWEQATKVAAPSRSARTTLNCGARLGAAFRIRGRNQKSADRPTVRPELVQSRHEIFDDGGFRSGRRLSHKPVRKAVRQTVRDAPVASPSCRVWRPTDGAAPVDFTQGQR